MLKYTDTTVFNVGAQTIVNTVNCVGVMGAGLALECQLRFPEMFQDYVERCKSKLDNEFSHKKSLEISFKN
jgi:O-acetyl-ADP-ribose deacetylase (regulator of RNase III)